MTPAEHYREAERRLAQAASADDQGNTEEVAYYVGAAQVHATLAAVPAAHGPAGGYEEGDEVTIIITGVRCGGLGDEHLYLDVPGVEEGMSVLLCDDEGVDLPQVKVYRTAKAGA